MKTTQRTQRAVTKKTLEKLYYLLLRVRLFEEKIIELYPAQEMRCPVHLSMGQEAVAAGVCAHLTADDYVVSNHRNHGHLIAKGADMKPLFAELYGRSGGCSRGKGGSMHMISVKDSVIGTSAIVGGGLPIAVGAALAADLKKEKRVSVVFFGDGAVDEGSFYESLNFAARFRLPVIFVCENNFYATNSPQKARQANPEVHQIADFFRIPGLCVDGNDLIAVYAAADAAIKGARAGKGPSLIEARTYRWCTHVGPESDVEKGFRRKDELDGWLKKCPVKKFRKYLADKKILSPEVLGEIEGSIAREIDEALRFAQASPYPADDELSKDVY